MFSTISKMTVVLAVTLFTFAAQAQTISLVTGNNYYPYSDERLTGGGLATIIVTTVIEEMGATPEITYTGWEEGYTAAQAGQYVGTFPYIYSEERHGLFHYSDPIFAVRPYVFVSANQSDGIRRLEHLAGKKMCVPNGWGIDGYLRDMVDSGDITMLTGTNVVGCFQALRDAQVDAISMDRRLGTAAARVVEETTWFRAERMTDNSNSHYVIVSRNVPNAREWLDQFNETLRRLQGLGTITELTAEYYESYE